LAEVATLYLLGIGDLTEPYYWLCILLISMPFVLVCFLLVRFVASLSLRDVLHLSLYPIGAGVFTGAAFALVASAVVGLLVAVGYIPDIKYVLTQWGEEEQLIAVNLRVLRDCQKAQSLIFTILATGLQEAYTGLKHPFDEISWLRPTIAFLYLVIAARFFMAAVDRRKPAVFGVVLLAALVATGATYFSLFAYLDRNLKTSGCADNLDKLGLERMAESALKNFAAGINDDEDDSTWDVSYRAEGRVLFCTWRSKQPLTNMEGFHRAVRKIQTNALEMYCANEEKNDGYLRNLKGYGLKHLQR
jgi:hypothetical protein